MLYHEISPKDDDKLQQGLSKDATKVQRAIACVTVVEDGLKCFWSIFDPKSIQYTANDPFCMLPFAVNKTTVELIFQMNEAGISKIKEDFLKQLKASLLSGAWLERKYCDGKAGYLEKVVVGQDYNLTLYYKFKKSDGFFSVVIKPDGSEKVAYVYMP